MKSKLNFAVGLALGVGIGSALGVAFHNLPIGVALGTALGVTLALLQRKSTGPQPVKAGCHRATGSFPSRNPEQRRKQRATSEEVQANS